MHQIILNEVINVSKDNVWNVLVKQFGDVHKWNPNLQGSHFMNGATEGNLDCERHCSLDNKTYFKEKITDIEDGKSVDIKITSSNFPFVHEMSGKFYLNAITPDKTEVKVVISVSTKPAIMVHLLKLQMGKLLKKSLIGLKYYLETGREVSDTNFRVINLDYKKLSPTQAFAA